MNRLGLSLAFFVCSIFGFSQNHVIDSLQVLVNQSEGKRKIQFLLALCSEYRYVNADTARNFGTNPLEMARREGDEALEAEALYNIGVTHETQGNYPEALNLFI